jgi:hypothetical protein
MLVIYPGWSILYLSDTERERIPSITSSTVSGKGTFALILQCNQNDVSKWEIWSRRDDSGFWGSLQKGEGEKEGLTGPVLVVIEPYLISIGFPYDYRMFLVQGCVGLHIYRADRCDQPSVGLVTTFCS